MTDEQTTGAQARREGMVSRYQVDVGEAFPLSEEEREERCAWQGHGYREWRRDGDERRERYGFRAPKLVMLFAAIAVGVALIATAASYPLATLAAATAIFFFAREHHYGRGYRPHRGCRQGRRDAA